MKLYYLDQKHVQIISELNLGKLESKEEELIEKVIAFLREKDCIDGRYKDLELLKDCEVCYDDGEPFFCYS